jgi:hypothetical protein
MFVNDVSCYCFLSKNKALTSLENIIKFAAHIDPNSLLEGHIRQMASIGVVKLLAQPMDKVVLQDDFNPDPKQVDSAVEMVQFEIPHTSPRGRKKRKAMFLKTLLAFDVAKNHLPDLLQPLKRPRTEMTLKGKSAS